MQVHIHRFPVSNCFIKKNPRIASSSKKTQINIPTSTNQMVIPQGGKFHRAAVW